MDQDTERWEEARRKVLARWRDILIRIEARDEPGVLALANVMDEFCDEAMARRMATLQASAPSEPDLLKFSGPAESIGTRCLFCRGFQEAGGCFGMLAGLNHHVLAGRWDEARTVAETYVARLEALYFEDLPEPRIH